MQKTNKNLIVFLAMFAFLYLGHSCCYAAYDVIKAKTIENDDVAATPKNDGYLPTFNDPSVPNFSEEDSVASKIERGTRNLLEKLRRKKTKIENETIGEDKVVNEDNNEAIKPLSPRWGENEVVDDENKYKINADKVTYDDTEGNVYAKGNVEIIAPSQKVTLKANEAILDRNEQTLKLYDNVKIVKGGVEMVGEYMLVDLNEQNILMDNPSLDAYSFEIKAQEGFLIENDIQMINGNVKSIKDTEIIFETTGFHRATNAGFLKDEIAKAKLENDNLNPNQKQSYKIDAKEIIYTSYKDHNSLVLKGTNVYYNNHRLFRNTNMEIISDKERQVVETNSYEFGSIRGFGIYAGYGVVSKLPKGHTFKIAPILSYKGGMGVGFLGRYRTQNGMIEAGYNTSAENLVVDGKYKFGKGVSLAYGRHAYLPESFLGRRRPGYAAELQYNKAYKVEDLGAGFSHGIYAGLFSDYKTKHQEKNVYSTTRFRYMAQLRKTFLNIENKEQDMRLSFYISGQTAATLYGSGNTTGIARIGPFIHTQVKKWHSTAGYYLAGVHGTSPFKFDRYMYGKSSIVLNEYFNISDKFGFGYRTTITPLKDNRKNDLITESSMYLLFGPRDLKLQVSYDFVRDIGHIDFLFILGTSSSKINFDRFITKNIDKREEKQKDFYRTKRPQQEVYEDML